MAADALRLGAERGDAMALRTGLEGGANPCSRDIWGLTALHYAVWNGNIECVKYLCANHLGVMESKDMHTKGQTTKLAMPKPKSTPKKVPAGTDTSKNKALVAGGGGKSRWGKVKAAAAAAEAAVTLEEHGVHLRTSCMNIQSHMGQTPMHMAASEGSNGPEIIRLLKMAGAVPDIVDFDGMTPYQIARQKHRDMCADMLSEPDPEELELETFRSYLNDKYKVTQSRKAMKKNPKLQGFDIPTRMPMVPKELDIPEEFVVPYARKMNEQVRGVKPMKDLEYALDQMTRNEVRRYRLSNALDIKIAMYGNLHKSEI